MTRSLRTMHLALGLTTSVLLVTSCASPQRSDPDSTATSNATADAAANESTAESTSDNTADGSSGEADRVEVTSLTPRVVMTYDGGILTLNGHTGELISDTEVPGFLRLSHLGDGRHLAVSSADAFTVFDSGLIDQPHGDHSHYYESAPTLTDVVAEAPGAGHVVAHEGRTALFADDTGEITLVDSAEIAEKLDEGEVETTESEDPHHGVAVPLKDGKLLVTQGTEDERHTVQVLDSNGQVVAETNDCPGVHGEAVAAPTQLDDVVSLGCENGPVIYRDGAFHKVSVPEPYQRSGNQFGSESSPIVLADYKVDQDADLERPTRIGLIDTRSDSVRTVELGSAYWFRSLARGPEGQALVLTYDGELNILDPDSGDIAHEVPVIEPWEENGPFPNECG